MTHRFAPPANDQLRGPTRTARVLALSRRVAPLALSVALLLTFGACEVEPVAGADDRSDHRCGPDFASASCGTNRCCSRNDYCGGLSESHCGGDNGYGGRYDGPSSSSMTYEQVAARICANAANVAGDLGCTGAPTESACLAQQLQYADDPNAIRCTDEYADVATCYESAPLDEWTCGSQPGDQPTVDSGTGQRCTSAISAWIECVTG